LGLAAGQDPARRAEGFWCTYKQYEQREQPEQSEQYEQYEQSEQYEQYEQYEQSEQPEQFLRLSNAFCAASSLPQRSTLHRLPLASVIQVRSVMGFSPSKAKARRSACVSPQFYQFSPSSSS